MLQIVLTDCTHFLLYVYLCKHVSKCVCICVICICLNVCVMCMYVCMPCICICICVYVHVSVCVSVCDVHACMYICMYMCLCVHVSVCMLGKVGVGEEIRPSCKRHGSIPESERPLQEGMATHSSVLAWRIP